MDHQLDILKRALTNLALPADRQAEYLDALLGPQAVAYGTDELALELDDAFAPHLAMHAQGLMSERQIAAVRIVDEMLADLSGKAHASFWTREALTSDPRWDQVRLVAQAALGTF
ncbi:MAG TPA: hypothetical protein VGR32_09110 [Brevundimonas sp.]|jgi:hypothetical protein|uniref:hypothetical protein n=1 Tax=Brevundimonas sp. TaxID=1871086 RepID=UPI002DF60D3B|nr:hypothetical protein [Brevundimonas sp.]